MSQPFAKGDRVLITSYGHRQDGRSGTIYGGPGPFMGTWTVTIDGEDYGFLPSELTIIERGRTTDPSTEN